MKEHNWGNCPKCSKIHIHPNKGRVKTLEQRHKISESRRGKKYPNLSLAKKGKKNPKLSVWLKKNWYAGSEHAKVHSQKLKGLYRDHPEYKEKNRLSHLGQLSWNKGRKKYSFICNNCGVSFATSKKTQKYCSRKCFIIHYPHVENNGQFKKGEHRGINTEFKKGSGATSIIRLMQKKEIHDKSLMILNDNLKKRGFRTLPLGLGRRSLIPDIIAIKDNSICVYEIDGSKQPKARKFRKYTKTGLYDNVFVYKIEEVGS